MKHYDVIIIGTGAGGGTLAHKLAPSGKKILLLERGGYLPRERRAIERRLFAAPGKLTAEQEAGRPSLNPQEAEVFAAGCIHRVYSARPCICCTRQYSIDRSFSVIRGDGSSGA